MKVLVIIPAYNEAANIAQVIAQLHDGFPDADLLVVNDASTDPTGMLAEKTGLARVIHLPCNLGIGGAVQTGFIFAVQHAYEAALQFDGDGQHLATEIPALLEPLRKGDADVVIGSRFRSDNTGFRSSPWRRIGIRIFSVLNFMLIKQKITDNTSGFRAYNREAFTFLAASYPSDYPEPEAVLMLGKNGFRIREVETRMQARQGGRSSIRGLLSAYYMLKVLLGILMGALRPKLKRR